MNLPVRFPIIVLIVLIPFAAFAQTERQIVLANDAMYYYFDAAVIAAPGHDHALVIFGYAGNPAPITRIGTQYIKSAVLDKHGRLGPETILAAAEWYYDGGAPALQDYSGPRINGIVWNAAREGFDLLIGVNVHDSAGYKFQLRVLPLDAGGKLAGDAYVIRGFEDKYSYLFYYRQLVTSNQKRSVLSMRHEDTGEFRVLLLGSRGRTRAERVIPADDFWPELLIPYGNDRLCLYSGGLAGDPAHAVTKVSILNLNDLSDVPGSRNFEFEGYSDGGVYADNTHLFFTSEWNMKKGYYSTHLRSMTARGVAVREKIIPRGSVLALQPSAKVKGSPARFSLFTLLERDHPFNDEIWLTQVDVTGRVIEHPRKVFGMDMSESSHQPTPWLVTEYAGGAVAFTHYNMLYVNLPQ